MQQTQSLLRRITFLACVLLIAGLHAACGDVSGISDSGPSPTPTSADTDGPPTSIVPGSVLPVDPLQSAQRILSAVSTRDIDSFRQQLVPEFHGFSDQTLEQAVLQRYRWVPTDTDWHVEPHEDSLILRHPDRPEVTLYLRLIGESLRLDPGPHVLRRATLLDKSPGPHPPQTYGSKIQRQYHLEEGEPNIAAYFNSGVINVFRDHADVIATIEMTLMHDSSGGLDMTGHTWIAGDSEGVAEVVWTTAVRDEERLTLPALVDHSRGGLAGPYIIAFRLSDMPNTDTISLLIAGVTVDRPDEPASEFAIEFTVPDAPYPPEPGSSPAARDILPTPDAEGVYMDVTFDEARQLTPFPLVMPETIPDGLEAPTIALLSAPLPIAGSEPSTPYIATMYFEEQDGVSYLIMARLGAGINEQIVENFLAAIP
jgi:hypothetical protein